MRVRAPLVICETRHGFICASAGVDQSNTPEAGTLVLLPLDPDASAVKLREELRARTGRDVGVIITDSFGRPWRQGTTDVAIGAAGVQVMQDLSGGHDPIGYELKATFITVADEIAGAAQLVSGKLDRNPVTVVRGLHVRGEPVVAAGHGLVRVPGLGVDDRDHPVFGHAVRDLPPAVGAVAAGGRLHVLPGDQRQ